MLSRLALSLWLLAVPALCQEAEEVERYEQACVDLTGKDLRRMAWAAYRAPDDARIGKPLRQALETVLRARGQDLPGGAWQRAAGAVLDALIRTGTKVPSKELAPWFDVKREQALVLAARDVKQHAGLLVRALDDRHRHGAWVAACNLLLRDRPELLVPELAKRCRVALKVMVVDPDSFSSFHSVGMASACGTGVRDQLEDWPPLVFYLLVIDGVDRNRFAPGPTPVRYFRGVRGKVRYGRVSHVVFDRVDYGFRCLRSLAGDKVAPRLTSRVVENVEWDGADKLRVAVHDIAAELRADYREMLVRLARRKLLSPMAARQAVLPIDLEVEDQRDEDRRKQALPRITLPRPKLR